MHHLPPLLRGLLLFHLVCLAWIFFRSRTLEGAGTMLAAITTDLSFSPADWSTVTLIFVCAGPLLGLDLWEEQYERRHGAPATDALPFVFTAPAPLRGLVYALLLLYIAVVGAPAGVEFIYFQF
jgi:hypothetical protein